MLGRFIIVIASGVLAYLGVIGIREQRWVWIVATACFLAVVFFAVMDYRREKRSFTRFGRGYEIILSRVLSLIADLADLTAGEFGLWVIDLYLPTHTAVFRRKGRVRKLVLSLHIALTDIEVVQNEIETGHQLFGRCFSDPRSGIWWDIELAPLSEENLRQRLDEKVNDQLKAQYGIVSVNPVVDNLGRDCRGILVIHAKRDAEAVIKALGALTQSEGKRRIAIACVDIHNHLRTP